MNDIRDKFKENLDKWAFQNIAPLDIMEESSPIFCEKLGIEPRSFTFKGYANPGDENEWSQIPFEFSEILEGTMYMYLPSRWSGGLKQKDVAQVAEGQRVRQTLMIASKDDWKTTLEDFYDIGDIAAFAYYPIQVPYYDQWIACIDKQQKMWVYTFYGAGEWILVTKGDAGGRNTLELQVTSSVHSSPWYSWIAAG
ncbi:MAG TPA: hypothetical protein PKC98_00105 [Candidatus Melainabacteria bacterium]|nr:hypothetical protein [Candidatus Melainabacteria bacterium]